MTRILGILGHPIAHSLSPAMQNAAIQYLNIDAEYIAFDVMPNSLGKAIYGAEALGFHGLNITIPHKIEAVQYCVPDDRVRAIGALNTLKFGDDTIYGYNTDVDGVINTLKEADVKTNGKCVLVVGAGGASRAVVYALITLGSKVFVANRTLERAKKLSDAFKCHGYGGLDDILAIAE